MVNGQGDADGREKDETGNYLVRFGAVIILATLLSLSYVQAQTSRQIAQGAFPAVVMLVMSDANSQPVSLGSVFFISSDVVATNLHVIAGAARGYAKIIGQEKKYSIAGVVGVDAKHDLVLLKISGAKAPALPLGDSGQIQVGDEVYAVGNPYGLEGTFSQGIVSGIRRLDEGTIIQLTAPVSPGSSGGPILDQGGQVIGIAVATFADGQNLNFAIPVYYLRQLMGKMQPVVSVASVTGAELEKSMLNSLEGNERKGVVGAQLRWEDNSFSDSHFSFSLRNLLQQEVKEVYCLVIFYDEDGEPLDTVGVYYRGSIPPGLAVRVQSQANPGTKRLTTKPILSGNYFGEFEPYTRVEFRVLDFRVQ